MESFVAFGHRSNNTSSQEDDFHKFGIDRISPKPIDESILLSMEVDRGSLLKDFGYLKSNFIWSEDDGVLIASSESTVKIAEKHQDLYGGEDGLFFAFNESTIKQRKKSRKFQGAFEALNLPSSKLARVSKEGVKFAKLKFVELASNEYFEYGYTQSSERYLLQFASDSPDQVGELIQSIYLQEAKNSRVVLALLNAVASIGYHDIKPYGQVLAIAALANPAAEVKEAGIRAYEAWGDSEGVSILMDVDCPWPWLDSYRKQVISDLGGGA